MSRFFRGVGKQFFNRERRRIVDGAGRGNKVGGFSFAYRKQTAVRNIFVAQKVIEAAENIFFGKFFAYDDQIAENQFGHPACFCVDIRKAVAEGGRFRLYLHARSNRLPLLRLGNGDLRRKRVALFRLIHSYGKNDRRFLNVHQTEVVGKEDEKQDRR